MAKIRKGFVSNSSSSSFIIMTVGNTVLIEDGDTGLETCGGTSIEIDELMSKLQEAKLAGHKTVEISHGGGYDG